jgi:pilus assembly protein CpaC
VQTEIELESGQSFGIAGLLDNRAVETFNKIPGLSNIPLIGKLFQSKSRQRNNSELLVLVTPELVRPIPAGRPTPELKMPLPFIEGVSTQAPRTPGMDVTGPVPVKPTQEKLPVEELIRSLRPADTTPAPAFSPYIVIPNPPVGQPAPSAAPSAAPAQAAPSKGATG